MPSGFDWRTDEEKGWEKPLPPGPAGKRKLFQFSLGQLIFGSAVLILVLVLVFLFFQNRLAAQSKQIEDDVMASHSVFISAVQDRDPDRFLSMLSKKDTAWRQLQEDILRHQLILSRIVLGLRGPIPPPSAGVLSPTQIILSPDLNRAEVKEIFLYEALLSDGVAKNILLEQTFHYILDGTSWLQDKNNDEEYWGPWLRFEGKNLILAYHERDSDLAARLVIILDDLISTVCDEPEVKCPDDLQLVVRLDSSQRSLIQLQEGPFEIGILSGYGPETIDLPSPTIVGRPVNEGGYEALNSGYTSWLAAILFTNYYSGDVGIDEALVARQLTDWGLAPLPAIEKPVPFRERISFPADISPPGQNIMMLCSDAGDTRVIEYDMSTGEWSNRSTRNYTGQNNPFFGYAVADLSRLSDYSHAIYAYQESGAKGPVWRIYLWEDGAERLLFEEDNPLIFWPAIVQPDTNSPQMDFVMYQVYPEEPDRPSDLWTLPILDCLEGNCNLKEMKSLPFYSPSREYSILLELGANNQLNIYRGDEKGKPVQLLGSGMSPRWLDNYRYAYLSTDDGNKGLTGENVPGNGLIEGRISSGNTGETDSFEVIITTNQLRDAIPDEERPDHLMVDSAIMSKDPREHWYILANSSSNPDDGVAFLFDYDREENNINLLRIMKGRAFEYSYPIGYAGRHIGYLTYDGSAIQYLLLSTESDTLKELGQSQPSDRSADGSWFLFAEMNGLSVVSAEHDFEWMLSHNLHSCYNAVWINQEGTTVLDE